MTNTRARRMRRELRDRVGEALRIPVKQRDQLDCLRSDHLFVTFMPGAGLSRADFDDARPLLRQALVAACAAGETYVGDRAMERVGPLITLASATPRLRRIPMDLGGWLEIDSRYDRKKWGLRGMVIEPYIRQEASTDPTKVGFILSLFGVESPLSKLDASRGVARGETKAFLDRLTQRRNRIAHEGDRVGKGRASLTVGEVRADLEELTAVVQAIQAVTQP